MFTTSPKNVWSPSKAVLEPFFAGIQVGLSSSFPPNSLSFFSFWVNKMVSLKLYHYYCYAIITIIIIIIIIVIIKIINIIMII